MKVREVILYNPYDFRFSLKNHGFTEIDFYNHFFCLTQELRDCKAYFDKSVNSDNEEHTQICILSGYSGCGKTTFINWFKNEIQKDENVFFHIINLIQDADGLNKNGDLIKRPIANELSDFLLQQKSLTFIVENKVHFSKIFNNLVNGVYEIDTIINFESKYNMFDVKDEYQKKQFLIDIYRFIDNLSFKSALIIYFLENTFRLNNDIDNCIFCFDNLDELEYEYLSVKMWDEIVEVLIILHGLFIKNLISFDFNEKLTIILVLREANITISNAQLNDRLTPYVSSKRIRLTGSTDEIVKKRVHYIESRKDIFSLAQNQLYELLKIFNHDLEFISTRIMPLLNFDIRKLFHVILFISNSNNNESLKHEVFTCSKYIELSNIDKFLARGIIFNYLINFSIKKYFDKFITSKSEGCRPSRLILTAIYNLSYPNGVPDAKEERNRMVPERISFLEFIRRIRNFYELKTVLDYIELYFNIRESSWAHLITIHGVKIVNNKIEYPSQVLSGLIKIYSGEKGDKLTQAENTEFNQIEIQFNASGFGYLRYMICHFEYFSYQAIIKYNDYIIYKPLINMLSVVFQSDNENSNVPVFEFEIVISDVLKMLKEYKEYIDIDFDNTFRTYTPDKFVANDCIFSFGENNGKKHFYMSRVITTHISYIDKFRFFLYTDHNFKNNLNININKFPSIKNTYAIQDFLINRIEDYVVLLKVGVLDPTMKRNVQLFEENIKKARYDKYKNWTNIGINISD